MNVDQKKVRNKEHSKQRFLDVVGQILRSEGFSALKVNYIAEVAGLDKKLIYNYFGGLDGLIDAYFKSVDFWSKVNTENSSAQVADGGKELSKDILMQQFDYIAANKEIQKVLLWGLSEQRTSLQKVHEAREAIGEQLFSKVTDPFFGTNATQYRAIMALLVSGIYYLDMVQGVNADFFCGIDITKNEGRVAIKKALAKIVDLIYQDQL